MVIPAITQRLRGLGWPLRVLLLAAALFTLVVGCNWLTDPVGLDCTKTEPLVNFTRNERAFKAHHYACEPHRKLILGTSRASFGLRASDLGPQAYNLALSASTVQQQIRYWQHAMALGPVDEVVHLVDLFAVLKPAQALPQDREDALMADAQGQHRAYRLTLDTWRLLFSIQTFRESLKSWAHTLRGLRSPPGTLYSRLGDALDYAVPGAKTRKGFIDHEKTHVGPRWQRFMALPAAQQKALFETSLDEIEHGLRLACAQGIRYTLAISPAHAWHWAGMEMIGIAPLHEAMKRQMLLRRDRVAATAHCTPAPIWDFQGFQGYANHPPPEHSESPEWFDSGHFQPVVGRDVLATLRGRPSPSLPAVLLTAAGVDAHQAQLKADYAAWVQANSADAAMLADIAAQKPVAAHE